MKDQFRQSMAWLHTWLGVLSGWVLYFMFVTGTAGYLDTEIDRWMRPELPAAQWPLSQDAAIGQAHDFLQAQAGDAPRWTITLPLDRNDPFLQVSWRGTASGSAWLDPHTGQRMAVRDTGGGQWLYQLHWRLHYLPARLAEWIVGAATMALLVALVTGVVAHRRLFADFFTFRPGKGQRSWLDAHNLVSVVSLPFQFMIAYSGLVFVMFSFTPLIVVAWFGSGERGQRDFMDGMFPPLAPAAAAGRPAPLPSLPTLVQDAQRRMAGAPVATIDIQNPGDAHARVLVAGSFAAGPVRTTDLLVYDGVSGELLAHRPAVQSGPRTFRDLMLGLHEGLFAGPLLRALYVLSGALACAMIATGLVLWTVKRRQRVELGRALPHAGLRLVERLNVAVVAGLVVAVAAYFWANRLIPAALPGRAALEQQTMFCAWAATFLHAVLRRPARAWVEQWAFAGLALALLPLLNAATGGLSMPRALAAGDWALGGFDATALLAGTLLMVTAVSLHRRADQAVPC
jgi:uncharacterized iron-regulated membrane protein